MSESGTAALNKLIEATYITVEGKQYMLVMNHRAYIEIEELTGISTILEPDKIFDRPSRKTLSAAFYVLLKGAGAKYTLDDVQRMTRGQAVGTIFTAVLSAHAAAQMEEDDAPLVTATATQR